MSRYRYTDLHETLAHLITNGCFAKELSESEANDNVILTSDFLSEIDFEFIEEGKVVTYNLHDNIFKPVYGKEFLGVVLPLGMVANRENFDYTDVCMILSHLIEKANRGFRQSLTSLRSEVMEGCYNNNCISIVVRYRTDEGYRFFTVTYYTNTTSPSLSNKDNAFINFKDLLCEIIMRVIILKLDSSYWSSFALSYDITNY